MARRVNRCEAEGGLDGEGAGATAAAFGDEEEAVGSDHIDPASGACDLGDGGAALFAGVELVHSWVSASSEEVAGRARESAATVAAAIELEIKFLSRFDVEGARAGVDGVADDDRMLVLLAVVAVGSFVNSQVMV